MMQAQWMQPVLESNKMAFQVWYQTVSHMQDQAEQVLDQLWEQSPVAPEAGKKAYKEWIELCKKERENLKKTWEQGFETWENLLAGAEPAQQQKPEKAKQQSSSKSATA
ncbi:MAG: hypothetical protein ACLFM3_08050 [Desulfohalobiaceae bacterium]